MPEKTNKYQDYFDAKEERKSKWKKRLPGAPLSVKLRRAVSLEKGKTISDAFPVERKKLAINLKGFPNVKNYKVAQAAAAHLMGDTQEAAAEQFGVSMHLIQALFSAKYPAREKMEELLETVLLGNAHIASAIFAKNAPQELAARDAAVAAGIFSSRYMEVKQQRENKDRPTFNVGVIIQLQQTLSNIDAKAKAKQLEGKIIDV